MRSVLWANAVESTLHRLERAFKANFDPNQTLENQAIEMTVDRVMCPSCRTVLPAIGLELGNPTVRFVSPSGSVRIMRDGSWK